MEGRNFSQVIATAITFSYVYSKRHKAKGSLVPAIQVSNSGLAIFFYDCKLDVLVGQIFTWTPGALVILWAALNYRIFIPQLTDKVKGYKFGYEEVAKTTQCGFKDNLPLHYAKKLNAPPFSASDLTERAGKLFTRVSLVGKIDV